ncbi:Uma2 family endonuclease [Lachnospiraceae bacterium 29-84]
MNGNLAYQEEPWEEKLNGQVILMSPRPSVNHNRVAGNIYHIFRNYLKGKTCEAFSDGIDVFLTEEDNVIPDAMIVCNKDIIKPEGIHGAPDLVVEVLSPSTAKNDRGYKKDLYEAAGVKEYWIADPVMRSIETYILSDGKYVLDGFYGLFPDNPSITKSERQESKKEIPVSLYDDFRIPLEEIFCNLF